MYLVKNSTSVFLSQNKYINPKGMYVAADKMEKYQRTGKTNMSIFQMIKLDLWIILRQISEEKIMKKLIRNEI